MPDRRGCRSLTLRRRWVNAAAVAVTLWLLMSIGLRVYVAYFGNDNATYGSIGGVILLMLWLYLTGLVLLFGSEVNAEIEHAAARRAPRTRRRRASGPPDPRRLAQRAARAGPGARLASFRYR